MPKHTDFRSLWSRAVVLTGALCLMGILLPREARAQAVAQISGTVRDESGSAVPSAQVTATQTDTGVKRTVATDDVGGFILANLPLGPYRLEAMKMGFRTYVQTGIELQVGSAPEIPVTLGVGQVSESVNVEANATQVETRSLGVGAVIETQRVLDLPLNGRQPTDLITLSGSAVQTATSPGYGMRTGVLISVGGGSVEGVQYNYDGAPHVNTMDGTGMPLPFPDALQEFRVVTSTQEASSVGRSGASVNAVTKSGTNSFHGGAFEFLRNYDANARDFFATQPDGLKRNQFGGTFGGPIKKDKIFFFFGYQGSFVRQLIVQNPQFVPTARMLRGDLSIYASAVCQGTQKSLKGPFVNNQINPGSFSKAAVNIANRLPTPVNECGLLPWSLPNNEDDHQVPVRVDYQLNSKQTLFARYLFTKQLLTVPYSVSLNPLAEATPGFNDAAQNTTIGDTYIVNANMVNSARLFVNRIASLKLGANMFGANTVGINSYTYDPNYLSLAVTGGFTLGSTTKNAFDFITDYGASDDYSIVHGSHLFAFGGYWMHSINWQVAQAFADGTFSVSGQFTGLGLADFLTGQLSQFRQESPNPLNVRQNFFSFYAKDTWKINSRLTLNYGLTWAPYFAPGFPQADSYIFDLGNFHSGVRSSVYPAAPPGFLYPGDKGFNGNSGIQNRWGNFDPRIGLAWDPTGDGKMVLRLGAGTAHDFTGQDLLLNNEATPPFRLLVVETGPVSLDNPWSTFPGGNPYPYNFNKTNPFFPAYASYLPVPADWKNADQYSWNAGIQRQLTRNWFASATYLGTHILHVRSAVELNPGVFIPGNCPANGNFPGTNVADGLSAAGPCTSTANINQRRALNLTTPGTQLGYMTQYDDGSTQSYHGLQLATTWRMQDNLSLNANYTWSKCVGVNPWGTLLLLNPGSNYIHSGYGNNMPGANDRNADIGPCIQDRRQIANITLVAQTPKFSNSVARMVGTGWTLSTTVVARTGSPFQVVTGTAQDPSSGIGGNPPGLQRPNQILPTVYAASQLSPGPATAGSFSLQWLNPGAFAAPAVGTYGSLGAFSIYGPGFWEWDEALSRQFSFLEKQRVEIRFEAFNLTNSLRPGNPNTTMSATSSFGMITTDATPPSATSAPARVLQFALKYGF